MKHIIHILCLLALMGCTKNVQGPAGPPLAVVTSPAPLSACLEGGTRYSIGSSTFDVCNGLQGDIGSVGPQGNPGAPGQDLTPISIVQFCPNPTDYPETFSEIGFCISGEIYAVYSLYDGFLTLVPPGHYQSHGVGSTCTFTVKANCEVDR